MFYLNNYIFINIRAMRVEIKRSLYKTNIGVDNKCVLFKRVNNNDIYSD